MSPNAIQLKRIGEGTYEVPFDYGQMKDLIVENWWELDWSNTRLLAAAALICISASMEYELDVLKEDARYKALESSLRWRYGKDESGRRIINSMEINISVDLPDELRSEFLEVVKEHMDHGCTITRSLKRGIPIKLNITEM
jgi:uncharacterized OsmC-like protein